MLRDAGINQAVTHVLGSFGGHGQDGHVGPGLFQDSFQ